MTESKFPMEFKKCPNCGKEKTITEVGWEEEIEAGRIPEASRGTELAALRTNATLIDPKRTIGISAAVLMYQLVICAGCGSVRCKRVDKVVAPVQIGKPGQMPRPKP